MSLVSGFPHHPVMHHHDSHYSFHAAAAAAAGRCGHDEPGGGAPYFTGWLISHADVSPTEYGLAAAGYSPEYHGGSSGGGSGGGGGGASSAGGLQDPHSHHHAHHHHYGPGGGAMVPHGGLSVNGSPVGMHHHAHHHAHHPGRPVKRRPTANRKERRRTQSINSAFAELRECIPNVPADTKLSKIKTLRLATSYIAYLMDILDKDGQHGDTEAFKADFKKTEGSKEERRKREAVEVLKTTAPLQGDKKTKGRTGWPQHVWALELKQ